MELLFRIIAVVLFAAAFYFYRAGNTDLAFASAVVGICGLFLGYRFRIKREIDEAKADRHHT
ncbi:MAG: hypothetical protein HS105_03245 [Chloracidobacterium sp.]|nr:hypothetical protein [Chloracidobacterium sp.]MCC6825440.1 hypothetical protein [Acidobacteriota bacterium]MCO5334856.1 hypothetical protein [Pyrinomonadaceae bacterium]